jgi:peptide deformylase
MRIDGTDARVVSHEVDHLDGVLYLDYLEPDSNLYIVRTDETGEEKLVNITKLLSSNGQRPTT